MVQEWADAVICPEDLALERIAGGVRSGFSPGLAPSGRPGFFVTAAADARGLPPRAALPIEALPPGQAGAAAANGFLQRVPEPAHPL